VIRYVIEHECTANLEARKNALQIESGAVGRVVAVNGDDVEEIDGMIGKPLWYSLV
jgi:hypothetical protein